MMQQQHSWPKLPWLKLLIPLIALVFIVVRIFWPGLQIDAITIGLLVVAFLPWLSTLIESAKLPGGYEFTFRRIEAKQEQQQSEVERLRFVVSHLLTEGELNILKQLYISDPYVVGPEPQFLNSPFQTELRHLQGLSFIEVVPDQHFSWFQNKVKTEKLDVKTYFKITEIGKKYLNLRDQVDSETSAQNAGTRLTSEALRKNLLT
jgi:hypothetical protein